MNTQQRAVMQQAQAYIRWTAFGECRTPGWDGPPPTAAEVDLALLQALAEPVQVAGDAGLPVVTWLKFDGEDFEYNTTDHFSDGRTGGMALVKLADAQAALAANEAEIAALKAERDAMISETPPSKLHKMGIAALYAAPQPAAVPKGYKLVPLEPTPQMLNASKPWLNNYQHMRAGDRTAARADAYSAMLAAVPKTKETP